MDLNTIELTLDTVLENYLPSISIMQNDLKADRLSIEILQNKQSFDFKSAQPILVCLKPSGKYTLNTMEVVDNRLEYTLGQQEVVEAGTVQFQVLLYGINGERYSTLIFDIKVENELVNTTMIESEIVALPLLSELLKKIDDLKLEVAGLDVVSIKLLLEGKRDKDIPIGESDLSLELLEKINEQKYDDSIILDEIEDLRLGKRNKSDAIEETDLSLPVREKLNYKYNDTDITNRVISIETLLPNTRKKNELINETDLSEEVKTKLSKISEPYNDTLIKSQISDLGVSVNSKRDKDVPIQELDLSLEVQDKLNAAGTGTDYDDSLLIGRIETLEVEVPKKRDKTAEIKEIELEVKVIEKLNKIVEPYNDTELRNKVTTIEGGLEGKRDKSAKIIEADLSEDVKGKLNTIAEPYNDEPLKSRVTSAEVALLGKRDKSVDIEEKDLSVEVKEKLNAKGGELGTDGKSAYEIAVKQGFVGTEIEWLDSLIGKQGKPGEGGKKGDTGKAFAYEDFTPAQLEKLKGKKGEDGKILNENLLGDIGEVLVWVGTQAQYNALLSVEPNTLYFVR